MKIAVFTDMFPPQLNGIATSLANQVEELGAQGHQIMVFTSSMDHIPRQKFKAKNVTVVYLPSIPSFYTEFKIAVFGLPKVIRNMAKFDPDVIHFHSNLTTGMDALTAAKIFKKPLVATIHIYFADSDWLGFMKYKLAIKILDKLALSYINFLYKNCDLLLTPSMNLIDELKKNGFKKTVHYLPNGIPHVDIKELSSKEKSEIKTKYNLKEKVIVHLGRLSYEKSVDVLIKSFYELTKVHDNISLLIIGDGPSRKNLVRLVKKLGIEKQVVFTGFIEHQSLLSSGILSIGDVFATASTMEVNPMVVLEAMAFGLPIVGVKQAGLIELVSDNGFLAKAGDTKGLASYMEKILLDSKLSSKMAEKSQQISKKYAIDKTVTTLVSFYSKLLKQA